MAYETDGCPLLGIRVLRFFPNNVQAHGTVVGWLPENGADEPALWRIEHDDGDAEDLSKDEVRSARPQEIVVY